jgi:hypothetical protein
MRFARDKINLYQKPGKLPTMYTVEWMASWNGGSGLNVQRRSWEGFARHKTADIVQLTNERARSISTPGCRALER